MCGWMRLQTTDQALWQPSSYSAPMGRIGLRSLSKRVVRGQVSRRSNSSALPEAPDILPNHTCTWASRSVAPLSTVTRSTPTIWLTLSLCCFRMVAPWMLASWSPSLRWRSRLLRPRTARSRSTLSHTVDPGRDYCKSGHGSFFAEPSEVVGQRLARRSMAVGKDKRR